MSRSMWKGPYVASSVIKKSQSKTKNFKIWSRNSVIPEFMINKTVLVHNGKEFKNVTVTREKVGFKFENFQLPESTTLKPKL